MSDTDEVDWVGVAVVLVFYALILAVGVAAAYLKSRRQADATAEEVIITAGRDLGLFVGVFTMIATWVGGGYVNGTVQYVFSDGLWWVQAPVGYAISLVVGGVLFAGVMRRRRYMTMIDPFQQKYGAVVGSSMYIPALLGEVLWSGAILTALASTIKVILHIEYAYSVIGSAAVAILYTFMGGLYSVAYTDVVQLICIMFGLLLCIPFAWANEHVHMDILFGGASASAANLTCLADANATSAGNNITCGWSGQVGSGDIGLFIDGYLLLIFGGIPWQVYFQRVLASRTAGRAQALSILGGVGCLIMSVPPIFMGLIARHTDWVSAGVVAIGAWPEPTEVLPYVIAKLTPPVVSYFGLGAIAAAVMSSSDSSILSASSMFAHNIYKDIFRPRASDFEVVAVLRGAIVGCGVLACLIALAVQSTYELWFLSGDLVYVILFPQLLLVIYAPFSNSYGLIVGSLLSFALRLLLGEPALSIPAVIDFGSRFPYWQANFPYKTAVMLCNLFVTAGVSALANWLFLTGKVPLTADVLRQFPLPHQPFGATFKIDWHELIPFGNPKAPAGSAVAPAAPLWLLRADRDVFAEPTDAFAVAAFAPAAPPWPIFAEPTEAADVEASAAHLPSQEDAASQPSSHTAHSVSVTPSIRQDAASQPSSHTAHSVSVTPSIR